MARLSLASLVVDFIASCVSCVQAEGHYLHCTVPIVSRFNLKTATLTSGPSLFLRV